MEAEELLAGVRRCCPALAEVTEGPTQEAPTWFVRRRSFATFVDPRDHRLDEPHVAIWTAAPPGVRHELPPADPERFLGRRPVAATGWVACGSTSTGTGRTGRRSVSYSPTRSHVAPRVLVVRLYTGPAR